MAQVLLNETTPNGGDLDNNFTELYSKTAYSTSGIGYATGAGGTVTQATSKSTEVTLNKNCGTIVMNGAALAANTRITFSCNNSLVTVKTGVTVNVQNAGTVSPANYMVWASPSAGQIAFTLHNVSGGSLSDVVTLNFWLTTVVDS